MNKLNKLSGIAHWLPRLSLAATFIYHGLPKLTMAGDIAGMMGMPVFVVIMLGLIEVGGSLIFIWGGIGPEWATRIPPLFFTAIMIGAISMIHIHHGWNSLNMGDNTGQGMEFQVLIIAVSLLYAFKGNSLNASVESK